VKRYVIQQKAVRVSGLIADVVNKHVSSKAPKARNHSWAASWDTITIHCVGGRDMNFRRRRGVLRRLRESIRASRRSVGRVGVTSRWRCTGGRSRGGGSGTGGKIRGGGNYSSGFVSCMHAIR